MTALFHYVILFSIVLVAEFTIERKYRIRHRIVNRLGMTLTFMLMLGLTLAIELITYFLFPNINNSQMYEVYRIGLIVYFLPRKGELEKEPK